MPIRAWIYWLAVVLISVVGTLIIDNLTDNLGVSLEVSTIGFSIRSRRYLRDLVWKREVAVYPHDLHDPT
jgi:uncharacterized membrane-anchored protein